MNLLYVNIMNWLAKFDTKEEGQGMVEYALILVLVSVVAITVLMTVGSKVSAVFTSIADSLTIT